MRTHGMATSLEGGEVSNRNELQGEFFVSPSETYRKFSVRAENAAEACCVDGLPKFNSEHPRKPGLFLKTVDVVAAPCANTFDVLCWYESEECQ